MGSSKANFLVRTPADLQAELKMMRQTYADVVIVVEGDTDVRFLRKFVENGISIIIARGRENAHALLEREHDPLLVAFVDSDFDRIEERDPTRGDQRICAYDYHDMETMLVSQGVVASVLAEYADSTKVDKFNADIGEVMEALAAALIPLAALRIANERGVFGLKFDGLKMKRLIPRGSTKMDEGDLLKKVFSKSSAQGIHFCREAVKMERDNVNIDEYHDLEIIRGHDVAELLGWWLQNLLGGLNGKTGGGENIESAFRLAFGIDQLRRTDWFQTVSNWLDNHNRWIFSFPK